MKGMVPVSVLLVGAFAPADRCERHLQPLAERSGTGRRFHLPCGGHGSPCGVSGDEVTSTAAEEGELHEVQRDYDQAKEKRLQYLSHPTPSLQSETRNPLMVW